MMVIKMNKKMIKIGILFLVCLGIACLFLYRPMIQIFTNIEIIKAIFGKHPFFGRIVIVLAMALQVIFIFLPGEIIEVFAGVMFGTIEGLILCLLGAFIGSYCIFVLVKKYGVYFVEKKIEKEALNEMAFLKNKQKLHLILFLLYFIPGTPKDILTYFMPLTNLSFQHFICITTLARIPSIITSTMGGSALSLQQFDLFFSVCIVSVFLSFLGIYTYKKYVQKKNQE